MRSLQRNFQELLRYPSAIASLAIILLLLGISAYTLISIPYEEAIVLWRGGEDIWYQQPKNALPAWVNYFRREKLAETILVDSTDESIVKKIEQSESGNNIITFSLPIEYIYDRFPQELSLYFKSTYSEKPPFVSVAMITPDGREVHLADFAIQAAYTYRASMDARLARRLGTQFPVDALFAIPESDPPTPLKGNYLLNFSVVTFEPDSNVEAELVVYGQVYGVAGTDHLRRDLKIALLWGIPVALSFGLLAALGTTFITMIIAAIGAWYSSWVDTLIQRITEINMVLPLLPILIMIGTFYSRSIWIILGITILLSIFGGGIKTYRAIFIQVREAPYIDAARAYGAGDLRIIFQYLVPRIVPLLIPDLVVLIPAFVFLEASLAVLGLGDPVLPTWGKIIQDAQANGAMYKGMYYWVLEPAILLMLTGLAFAMLGFALDRVFNPRLREA
jgi:peptide/nickel transport system permease protein